MVAAGAFGDLPLQPVPGCIVRFCSLRKKFLVDVPGATCKAFAGLGSRRIIEVEYAHASCLSASGHRLANFVLLHMEPTGHRLAFAQYDWARPPPEQTSAALWHVCINEYHSGITNSPRSVELLDRLRYTGEALLAQRPELYSSITFAFLMNKTLERFGEEEHVEQFDGGPLYRAYPGAGVIHAHHARKCDEEGHVRPLPAAEDWNGRSSDTDGGGGRQFVAGAVACRFMWKVGLPCAVGTFPQFVAEDGLTVKPAPKIPIGAPSRRLFLKPGTIVIAIGTTGSYSIGGVEYEGLLVECPQYEPDAGSEALPTAVLPALLYKSAPINGAFLYWIQWPIKYGLLCTAHSLTGRARKWLLMTFEYFWGHDAAFSLLTRAAFPPAMRGASLADVPGAVGIVHLADEAQFLDPCGMGMGLNPKVALRFHEVYGKPVPQARLESARTWVSEHTQFHLQQEALELDRAVARARVGASSASAAWQDA